MELGFRMEIRLDRGVYGGVKDRKTVVNDSGLVCGWVGREYYVTMVHNDLVILHCEPRE
jgi:hypothetical protein